MESYWKGWPLQSPIATPINQPKRPVRDTSFLPLLTCSRMTRKGIAAPAISFSDWLVLVDRQSPFRQIDVNVGFLRRGTPKSAWVYWVLSILSHGVMWYNDLDDLGVTTWFWETSKWCTKPIRGPFIFHGWNILSV